jgi:hypothetical protein
MKQFPKKRKENIFAKRAGQPDSKLARALTTRFLNTSPPPRPLRNDIVRSHWLFEPASPTTKLRAFPSVIIQPSSRSTQWFLAARSALMRLPQ